MTLSQETLVDAEIVNAYVTGNSQHANVVSTNPDWAAADIQQCLSLASLGSFEELLEAIRVLKVAPHGYRSIKGKKRPNTHKRNRPLPVRASVIGILWNPHFSRSLENITIFIKALPMPYLRGAFLSHNLTNVKQRPYQLVKLLADEPTILALVAKLLAAGEGNKTSTEPMYNTLKKNLYHNILQHPELPGEYQVEAALSLNLDSPLNEGNQ